MGAAHRTDFFRRAGSYQNKKPPSRAAHFDDAKSNGWDPWIAPNFLHTRSHQNEKPRARAAHVDDSESTGWERCSARKSSDALGAIKLKSFGAELLILMTPGVLDGICTPRGLAAIKMRGFGAELPILMDPLAHLGATWVKAPISPGSFNKILDLTTVRPAII